MVFFYFSLGAAECEVTFAIPLIEHLAKNIEEKLPQKDPILQRELIYSHFHQYELTNREKEIAYMQKRESTIKEHFLKNLHNRHKNS
jgi:hypothetical protein